MPDRDQNQSSAETLEYASLKPRQKKPWPRFWKRALIVAALYVLAVTLEIMSDSLKILAVLGMVVGFAAVVMPLVYRAMDFIKDRAPINEEEDDKKWQELKARERETVELAKKIYANGPIGTWRFTVVVHGYRGPPSVCEERVIKLEMNGKGMYSWLKRGEDTSFVETLFEYKLEREGVLSVRLSSPLSEDWHSVEFGFESHRDGDNEPGLTLWFESQNSLTLKERWPFWGEFQRSAK